MGGRPLNTVVTWSLVGIAVCFFPSATVATGQHTLPHVFFIAHSFHDIRCVGQNGNVTLCSERLGFAQGPSVRIRHRLLSTDSHGHERDLSDNGLAVALFIIRLRHGVRRDARSASRRSGRNPPCSS